MAQREIQSESTDAAIARDVLKGFQIPPQPKLISAVQSAMPNIANVAELIGRDPSLTSALLKTVNSAAYCSTSNKSTSNKSTSNQSTTQNSPDDKILSIHKAAETVGLSGIVSILNAVALRKASTFNQSTKRLEHFWESSTQVAIAMSSIVRQLNYTDLHGLSIDWAYCTGLFHNCGMPIIFAKHENYFDVLKTCYTYTGKNLTEIENRSFETNHSVLGYYAAQSWHLPDVISDAIRKHHVLKVLNDLESQAPQVAALLSLLKLAEAMIFEHNEFGDDHANTEWEQIKDSILDFSGVSALDFEELKDIVMDTVDSSALGTH